jgi:hypothetical protein
MLFAGLRGDDVGSGPPLLSKLGYPGSLVSETEGERVPDEALAGRVRVPWRAATLSSRHRFASAFRSAPTSFSGSAMTTRFLDMAVTSTTSPLLWWVDCTEINAT